MVAAIQPFLSGAISKTFNMPHNATVKDVERTFLKAWENGVKCITIYREGSKLSEPLRVRELKEELKKTRVLQRRKLPDDLPESPRHRFTVGGHTGYLHMGHDPETNELMEIFIRVARFGSTVGGLLDSYATLFSKSLQYGMPLEEIIDHMLGSTFPPGGATSNPKVPIVKSIMDYVARYLQQRFVIKGELNESIDVYSRPSIMPPNSDDMDISEDTCPECGAFMQRTGTCTQCPNCGQSSGGCG
jgi:ribonucleoside-diphosphate reductase alpha chain